MLRISFEPTEAATVLTLEGRVAGLWAAELARVWNAKAPSLTEGKLTLDISNVTYADADGTQVLREIYSQAQPEVVATTPWTHHLAAQIAAKQNDRSDEGHDNADYE